ncbi:hypothetical protein I203_104022 [Kwoniella mangroviensis CBS 8507]|uniref:uncharacterized protein n=1 Tax=Kwoniella mangroviensis CBS 8507 TaxID=1296122 RepID=UPI00080CFE65|nr:uncharacterized protein I203_06325 [Kwoniella mangroviensis CBS 8507]OCF64592.1 hypothetical protein I203_06325 [Kwoniella mangroviensis CBS 8507]
MPDEHIVVEDDQPRPAAQAVEPTPDERHCDPNADVVLVSKDQVHLRAYSHHLKQVSKFFADLFTLPSKLEPINLDFDSFVISIYLDLVIAPTYCYSVIIDQHNHDSETLKQLLQISEYTTSEEITKNVWQVIREMAIAYPQALLNLAHERQDLDLARVAIKCINSDSIDLPHLCGGNECEGRCASYEWAETCSERINDFQRFFRPLDPAYQEEFLQLMLLRSKIKADNPNVEGKKEVMEWNEEDWTWIAERFDPDRSLDEKI